MQGGAHRACFNHSFLVSLLDNLFNPESCSYPSKLFNMYLHANHVCFLLCAKAGIWAPLVHRCSPSFCNCGTHSISSTDWSAGSWGERGLEKEEEIRVLETLRGATARAQMPQTHSAGTKFFAAKGSGSAERFREQRPEARHRVCAGAARSRRHRDWLRLRSGARLRALERARVLFRCTRELGVTLRTPSSLQQF